MVEKEERSGKNYLKHLINEINKIIQWSLNTNDLGYSTISNVLCNSLLTDSLYIRMTLG